MNSGISDFLQKYSYLDIIAETRLDYNGEGFAFYPQEYYKMNIRIDWTGEKPKIMKYKDGEYRRKRLYIDALMMRAIKPNITFLELLYNLVSRRRYFYDNSDKVLTNSILIEDARIVLKMNIEDVYDLKPSKHGAFTTDALYCTEHGVTRRQHSRAVWKLLNHQRIGEWYDVSKSVNENYKYAQANKIKASLNTLKDFCRENNIDMHPDLKPIDEWYDKALSVKENLKRAASQGIKVSQTQLYNFCREHHINTKGHTANTGDTIQGEPK